MCGRYFINYNHEAGGDVCPGCEAEALVVQSGEIISTTMRWGFERPEGGLVINARVESIDRKSMFKALAQSQRCALPASGYYEWRGGDGQKFSIDLGDAKPLWLAGLYRFGASDREFVVLTQPPVSKIARIHNRMPLLLDSPEALKRWLMDGETPIYADDGRLRIAAQGPEQLQMSFE